MIDVEQTNGGDVAFTNGDISYVEPTGQHKRDILLAGKGCFKETPEMGVGAGDYLHDTDPEAFCRAVRRECARDGMRVKDIQVVNGELEINAEYA